MSAPENTPANQAAASERPRSLALAISCLPIRARLFLLFLVLCAALPAVVTFYGALAGVPENALVGFLAARPLLMTAAAALLAAAAVLLFEQPKNWSPRAYATQLRARASAVRSEYLAALARRLPPSGGQP